MANPTTIKTTRFFRLFWKMNDELKPVNFVEFVREIDASSIDQLRLAYARAGKTKPSYTAVIVKAAAKILKTHPIANRAVVGLPFFKRLIQFNNIDISVAVNIDDLNGESYAFAGTIRNTINQSLEKITGELSCLTKEGSKENEKRLKQFRSIGNNLPHFLAALLIRLPTYFPKMWVKHRGCGCWVNSPAKHGVDFLATIWPWPLSISFGMVKERPFVIDGQLTVRRTMPLIMVFDRRIMAGTPAAKVFNDLAILLENAFENMAGNDVNGDLNKIQRFHKTTA